MVRPALIAARILDFTSFMLRIPFQLTVKARGLCIFLTMIAQFASFAGAAPRCGDVHAGPFLGAPEKARYEEVRLSREIPGSLRFDSVIPSVARVNEKGETLGSLAYVIRNHEQRGPDILVEYVGVAPEARGTGVSTLLLAALLARTPGVERIVTENLIDVNREVYDRARADGLSHREALRQTPAYRSYSQLGFTEILSSHRNGRELSMEVGLDPAYREEAESHRMDFEF